MKSVTLPTGLRLMSTSCNLGDAIDMSSASCNFEYAYSGDKQTAFNNLKLSLQNIGMTFDEADYGNKTFAYFRGGEPKLFGSMTVTKFGTLKVNAEKSN
jgi:hypothetical protein